LTAIEPFNNRNRIHGVDVNTIEVGKRKHDTRCHYDNVLIVKHGLVRITIGFTVYYRRDDDDEDEEEPVGVAGDDEVEVLRR
jgi:hypothetical protein